jgi:molybdate/tungstate transport system substrate-binding protein
LLGTEGRDLLQQHGLNLVKPAISGEAQTIPTSVKSLIDTTQ